MKIGLYAYQTFGKTSTNADKGLYKILRAQPDLDLLVAPEYTNIPFETSQKISKVYPSVLLIAGTTLVKDKFRVFNRAFVMKNGKLIKKYDKKIACARRGYNDLEHYPGGYLDNELTWKTGDTSGVFLHDDKKFGIEICRDNSPEYKVLQREIGRTLDLQVVMGCGHLGTGNALKEKGFCLAVDGDKQPVTTVSNGVKKVSPNKIFPILVDGNDKLYVYYLNF